MKRPRWIAVGLIALLAVASFSVSLPRAFELVDQAGAAHDIAYIAYSYAGSVPNPVHPVSYQAKPLALARADRAGQVAIPLTFHAHLPFPLKSHPSFQMELVYVPRAHNALGKLMEGGPALPGVFEIELRHRARVFDLADRPELWHGSMMNLASVINRLADRSEDERPLTETDPTTATLTRELIAHFRQEYDSFLTRYADTPRPMPAIQPPDPWTKAEDYRRWKETIEASFAREPLWGQYISRMFRDELKRMAQMERELGK